MVFLFFLPLLVRENFFKKNKHHLYYYQDNFKESVCVCLWDTGAGLKFKGENLKLPIFIGYSAVPNTNFQSNTNALLIHVTVPSDILGKSFSFIPPNPISHSHLLEQH